MNAWANIQALLEMRDSSIHFYNRSGAFPVRLQEIGAASLKNFVAATKNWFGRDMSEFNFYLMPLSFIALPQQTEAVMAGSFGYEAEHYDVSMKVGELVLLPSVRQAAANDLIAASGTSCRHQIHDGTGRHAVHPAEILRQALNRNTR